MDLWCGVRRGKPPKLAVHRFLDPHEPVVDEDCPAPLGDDHVPGLDVAVQEHDTLVLAPSVQNGEGTSDLHDPAHALCQARDPLAHDIVEAATLDVVHDEVPGAQLRLRGARALAAPMGRPPAEQLDATHEVRVLQSLEERDLAPPALDQLRLGPVLLGATRGRKQLLDGDGAVGLGHADRMPLPDASLGTPTNLFHQDVGVGDLNRPDEEGRIVASWQAARRRCSAFGRGGVCVLGHASSHHSGARLEVGRRDRARPHRVVSERVLRIGADKPSDADPDEPDPQLVDAVTQVVRGAAERLGRLLVARGLSRSTTLREKWSTDCHQESPVGVGEGKVRGCGPELVVLVEWRSVLSVTFDVKLIDAEAALEGDVEARLPGGERLEAPSQHDLLAAGKMQVDGLA